MSSGELFGHLTFAVLLFLLLPVARLSPAYRIVLVLTALALAFLPVKGLSLGDYTRSYTDDLAITTLTWLVWSVLARTTGRARTASRHHFQLAVFFGAMALVLYPATLGMTSLDPYRLGFSPLPLLAVMWLACLWLWWQKNHLAIILMCAATFAWLLSVKVSDNYWDYLIDPVLGIYCLGYLLGRAVQARKARVRTAGDAVPL